MDYDFSQLNDKEFEIFVVDLLSVAFDTRIERFKAGKDGGVDGRFFSDSGNEIFIQCKHYIKSGYRTLISKLKNEELKKVKKLNPAKYIFVTSLPLSRANKKEIQTIFQPYIKKSNDIYGQEDLNDLLVKNPKVEETHFKLWITSTTVFNRIINNAIKGRSEFELEQIQNRSYKYIETGNHEKALKILQEKHVLLISGEPGIGKTTLAENLCLFFASKNYEFIDIEESLSEAENIYDRGKKQVYYFDDFLGSNYFEAIENKKDSHIVKFIERIKNDKSKRFILTSRTNILNSGIIHSSFFANHKIRNHEFMLTIDNLTAFDRARILYNHIWFSKLSEEFINELYEDKRYKEIINHKNFNPRLIEFISDIDRLTALSSSEYWSYILKTLNNPKDIWSDCFKVQNNDFVRNLVKLTVFNGGSIKEPELQNSFYRLNKLENLKNTSHTEKDFVSTSKLALKSFLNRYKSTREVTYSLYNSSIADFVLSEYNNNLESLAKIFKSLNTVNSLENLKSLERSEIIPKEHIVRLKDMLFEDAFKENKNFDYLIVISDHLKIEETIKETIHNLLIKISLEPTCIKEFSKLLDLLMHFDELKFSDYRFLRVCIGDRNLDEFEIKDLAEFMDIMDINDESLYDKLKEDLEYFLCEELDSAKSDIDISKYVKIFDEYDYDYDSDGIEGELSIICETIIDGFYSEFIRNFDIDFGDLISNIDTDDMITDYIDSLKYDDEGSRRSPPITFDKDIDDLFERT
jgi:hypothetical protein